MWGRTVWTQDILASLRFASPRPSLICGGFLWPSVLADIFLTYSLPQPPLYPDLGLWSVEWCVPGLTHWNFAHCLEDNLGGNEPARVFPPHFWPQGWGRGAGRAEQLG